VTDERGGIVPALMGAAKSRKIVMLAVPLAAVAVAAGVYGGDDARGKSNPATAAAAVTPIKTVTCPNRSSTQRFMGALHLSVATKSHSGKVWLMSSAVDCTQWSGKSNPSKLAKVGPYRFGQTTAPGVSNPFRLEVGSASRPQWRMRLVTKAANGSFKELYSFKLAFAPFPERTAYRGVFLCFTTDCTDVTRVKKCASTDAKNIGCGFAPEPAKQRGPNRWSQAGVVYRTPAFGGFKPFVIQTYTIDNPSVGEGEFKIEITENPRLG
jgi:hypothetical protein